ncbi:MAG: CoA-binding protein [Candidatus Kerfeldbacteria bacterium]|nr:CoA-binding protein [Candidatus Kerfeldbacteria bacterium]
MKHLHHRPLKSIHPFVSKHFRYAVVGASADSEKFGNVIFYDLLHAGFIVVPVNPKLSELGGVSAVGRLQDVTPKPDVAVVVVPPSVGLTVIDDAVAAGIKKLWFQPGAESPEVIQRAREKGLEVVADGSCIMVVRRQLGL